MSHVGIIWNFVCYCFLLLFCAVTIGGTSKPGHPSEGAAVDDREGSWDVRHFHNHSCQLVSRSLYYSPVFPYFPPRVVTKYFEPSSVTNESSRSLRCDSSYRNHLTVVRDVRLELVSRPRLLWCSVNTSDGVGRWIPRELLLPRSGHPANLSQVMSGDLSTALTWPSVWVPSRCRTFRYNVTTFLRCAERWHQRTNTTLWFYFMGDSTLRGQFCALLRLLSPGGECGGGMQLRPCFQSLSLGQHVTPGSYHEQYTYVCPPAAFRVSFHFATHTGFPYFHNIIAAMMSSARGGNTHGPSHLVYNTGIWEYTYHFSLIHPSQPMAPKGRKGKRVKRAQSRGQVWLELSGKMGTSSNPVNHTVVTHDRKKQMKNLLTMLEHAGFSGKFLFRSNLCNAVFDARAADEEVERLVEAFRFGEVVNVFNASICRGMDLLRDKVHYDRLHAQRPPREKPHLGALNVVVLQTLLNRVCNPLLWPGE